jgi:competence protein ComEA
MMRTFMIVLLALGLAAGTASAQAPAGKGQKAAPAAAGPINLKTATVAQLDALPGIG